MRFRPTRSKRNAKDDLDPALPCFNIAMQRAFRKPSMLFHQAQAMQHALADVARPSELPRLPKTSVTLQSKCEDETVKQAEPKCHRQLELKH